MRKVIIIIFIFIILCKLDLQKEKYTNIKSNKPIYLFWTGGYDSTFRLCQLLLINKKKVLPIYLIGENLDDSNRSNSYKRQNVKKELNSMDAIRKKLFLKYPFTKDLLSPTLILNDINVSSKVMSEMKKLFIENKISRPVTQYGSMAQVTYNLNENIEVCTERSDRCVMCKLVFGKDYCSGKVNKKNYNSPEIFKKFKFPVGNYTKKDMLNESIKNNFSEILKLTWSCWFPNEKGEPCNKCPMCRQRII